MYIKILWEKFKSFSIQLSQPHKRGKIKRYFFPIILMVLIFPMKLVLQYYAIEGAPYLLSTFIIILSAWYGGAGPGIFATLLAGTLSNLLFLEPYLSITLESLITTVIFIFQGFLISMISEAKRHADLQKDEFIYVTSHELKNPLAVAKGYLELLKRTKATSGKKKSQEYITIAETYVDKVTALINELLDVTKVESGKLTLRKEQFDFARLTKEIVRDQQLLCDTHKIKLEGKANNIVCADKARISQVITNMITNAIKYSPGKKKVIVTLVNQKKAVQISIQDFGVGLSNEAQRKVFDRFYRVSNTSAQGLGLGLYIAQQIVLMHKGKIWLESILGKGTTFYLQLPTKG